MFIETQRLFLRELIQDDFQDLKQILQDPDVMYSYEGPFSDEEVQEWMDKQRQSYLHNGYCLFAVIEKESNQMIGQCGLTMQTWKDERLLEIGYLFKKDFWGQGYAIEAALACREYAFMRLGAQSVVSIIRESNDRSIKVAERNGMVPVDTWTKHYRGVDMPHVLYRVEKQEEQTIEIPLEQKNRA